MRELNSMVIKQQILHSKFCPTACVDIAFQEQRGECLFLITTVYTDRKGKKQRAISVVGKSGKSWQVGFRKTPPGLTWHRVWVKNSVSTLLKERKICWNPSGNWYSWKCMRLMDSLSTALQPYNESDQGWDGMVENKEKKANKRKENISFLLICWPNAARFCTRWHWGYLRFTPATWAKNLP